jgi:hypothetical protein
MKIDHAKNNNAPILGFIIVGTCFFNTSLRK